ncbi:MAG: Na/Pi cotransporter family protein [Fusobacteriaceae bacterium]
MYDIIFKVIGGLGLFLYGMNYMSNGMQKLAGDRLKKILALLTDNRFAAIFMGIFVTGLVQSSSVSTVMTIGFVNASLLTLKQALGVILGANIGTTITGWVLVLKIGKYGLPIAGIAAIYTLFTSSEKTKTRALTVLGLGLVFLGLEIMSDGLKPVRNMPEFIRIFHAFSATEIIDGQKVIVFSGVIKAALVGALMTAVVQSSSATLGITITLAVQGLLNYETAVALVLGENVGTTITALLASLKATANAKRAAYAHTLINIIGVCWVIPIFPFYLIFLSKIVNSGSNVTKGIATAHTMFNIINVFLFIPFVGVMSRFLEFIVKDDKVVISSKVTHLDTLMAEVPSVVIGQTKVEILEMGNEIYSVFNKLDELYLNRENMNTNHKHIENVEERMDIFEKEITDVNFLILSKNLTENEVEETRENLIICDEYETISDYLLRISKTLKKLVSNDIILDEMRKNTIVKLHKDIEEIFIDVNTAYRTDNRDLYFVALKKCNNIKGTYKKARTAHLSNISAAPQTLLSTAYMDMLNNYRRIKEHLYSVIETFTKIS